MARARLASLLPALVLRLISMVLLGAESSWAEAITSATVTEMQPGISVDGSTPDPQLPLFGVPASPEIGRAHV